MEPKSTPVVPANRLLEVARLLSDGAERLHAELLHVPADRRQAVLEAVVAQVGDVVQAWSELVQSVVSMEARPPAPAAATAQPESASRPEQVSGPRRISVAGEPDPQTSAVGPRRGPLTTTPRTRPGTTVSAPESPTPAGNGYPRDELTGVLNRQSGYAAIDREIERCRREGQHLVLGYLNVDGMREINESGGPRAGDELLRKVAAGLRATLRSYDVIARLEGDEFLFSLPGADVTTAEKRIKELGLILGEGAPGASVSVGFAELQPEDSVDDLVARADDALVQARRRRGRRRLR